MVRKKTRKKNPEYGKKVTNAILTVAASVAATKGIEALDNQAFMEDKMTRTAVKGGATAFGLAGAVFIDNEMVNAVSVGVASGAANNLSDELMLWTNTGTAGMGKNKAQSAASDYLDLYSDMGRTTVDKVSIKGVQKLNIS